MCFVCNPYFSAWYDAGMAFLWFFLPCTLLHSPHLFALLNHLVWVPCHTPVILLLRQYTCACRVWRISLKSSPQQYKIGLFAGLLYTSCSEYLSWCLCCLSLVSCCKSELTTYSHYQWFIFGGNSDELKTRFVPCSFCSSIASSHDSIFVNLTSSHVSKTAPVVQNCPSFRMWWYYLQSDETCSINVSLDNCSSN